MIHSFSTEVWKRCGPYAAAIFYNIGYWCWHNRTNGLSFQEGKYWTYNSMKAFAEQFDYMSEKQIKTGIQSLRDEGLIETGRFNKSPYDRTLWYTISEKGKEFDQWSSAENQNGLAQEGKSIGPIGPIDGTDRANGSAQEGRPIPNDKPYQKPTDSKPDGKQEDGADATTPSPKATKHTYGEYGHVKLTDKERDTLFDNYGEAETLEAITFLDEYIEMKGTKYKSHYLALRKWVYQAVRDRKPKRQQASGGGYDWDNL